MKRSSVLTAFVMMLTPAAQASASYLHVADVMPRAQRFIASDARFEQATGSAFGHCWHNAPRIVECSYTLDGVWVCDVDTKGTVTCPIDGFFDPAAVPAPSQWYMVAVLRDGRLHVHAG